MAHAREDPPFLALPKPILSSPLPLPVVMDTGEPLDGIPLGELGVPVEERERVLHRLYTAPYSRKRRRRRTSISTRSTRSARSVVRSVWKSVRRDSVSDVSSSTSSGSSSSSSSDWDWRFWRDSRSSLDSDSDIWEPPTPQFTLIVPSATDRRIESTTQPTMALALDSLKAYRSGDTSMGAWWLDILSPTVSDIKQLQKILPLHPLTMEDILHQETTEKMEPFEALGYYFVVFRGLDESYFRYTPADSAANPRGRVDIVEGVGGKEGVEGVSVGAVNMYMIVFAHGIVTFHFEDISKHTDQVQARLRRLDPTSRISSHWIAYGLMDTVVDAFFPLINFIEEELSDVNDFLTDPFNTAVTASRRDKRKAPSLVPPKPDYIDKCWMKLSQLVISLSTHFAKRVEPSQAIPMSNLSHTTIQIQNLDVLKPAIRRKPDETAAFISSPHFNRSILLKRIAAARTLIIGLSRLLRPKTRVSRALRKRAQDNDMQMFGNEKRDIDIYYSDLFDHIESMQQALHYYDVAFAHHHPAYTRLLRIALSTTKAGTDMSLVKLSMVTVTFLSFNVLTGIFSQNVRVPHDGDDDFRREDGTLVGFQYFGMVVGLVCSMGIFIGILFWFIFWTSKRPRPRRFGGPLQGGAKAELNPDQVYTVKTEDERVRQSEATGTPSLNGAEIIELDVVPNKVS